MKDVVRASGDVAVTETLAACTDTGARGSIEHVQLTISSVPRLRPPGHAHR